MLLKRALVLLTAIFILFAATLNAQDAFEGKVKFKTESEGIGQSILIDYFVKGENIRMEMGGAAGAVILFDSKNIKMLMPAQGMYMEYPMEDLQGMADEGDEDYDAEDEPQITDEKKDILGYECTKWLFESGDGTVEMWITDELGSFMPMQGPMADDVPEWQEKLANGNFFPMLVTITDEGKKINAMEVVEVKEETLSKDLFTVPKNLNKMDMPFNMN